LIVIGRNNYSLPLTIFLDKLHTKISSNCKARYHSKIQDST
jgi:hypothetical protein